MRPSSLLAWTALLAALPLATSAAPPAPPLEVATRLLADAYAASVVDKLCSVQGLVDFEATRARRERPDLDDAALAEYRRALEAAAPHLREACGRRVRDTLGAENGPLSRYGERLKETLAVSPVPREFEQLRAYLESPAGRHAEAARRAADAEAYLAFAMWGQRYAGSLYDELGMMLRADVGPLPPREAATAAPLPPAPAAGAAGTPIVHARMRNGATLGSACASFYPITSRRLNEQGSVVMLVYVLETGHLGSVLVETSSGFPALDVAAAGCIGAMAEFEPQKRDGQPVASWQRMKWTWRLSE